MDAVVPRRASPVLKGGAFSFPQLRGPGSSAAPSLRLLDRAESRVRPRMAARDVVELRCSFIPRAFFIAGGLSV
jgi:hypothetical protein